MGKVDSVLALVLSVGPLSNSCLWLTAADIFFTHRRLTREPKGTKTLTACLQLPTQSSDKKKTRRRLCWELETARR